MPDFDHDLFDCEYLLSLIDKGIDITQYEFKRTDMDDLNIVARQLGEIFCFKFTIDGINDMPNHEKFAAERAACRTRDFFQKWQPDALIYIADYMDSLNAR